MLAHPRAGFHLMHSMSQPTAEALARLADFQRDGSADLGPMRIDREGDIGHVTVQNHAFLNSEDDVSTAALEVAIDLVLLHDGIRVGVLRGAPATHRKYAGRRILGSGINLTHLYNGQISLVEFMLERELGQVSKMYRGHDLAPHDRSPRAPPREALDRGRRQLRHRRHLSVAARHGLRGRRDRRLLRAPGAQGGDHPRLRQPAPAALLGERLARQAIFFNRTFAADSPEGLLLADEVVPAAGMEAAIGTAASEVMSAGTTSLIGNRMALRQAQEPLDVFRRYMATTPRRRRTASTAPR